MTHDSDFMRWRRREGRKLMLMHFGETTLLCFGAALAMKGLFDLVTWLLGI
jgi:hypothetical protein